MLQQSLIWATVTRSPRTWHDLRRCGRFERIPSPSFAIKAVDQLVIGLNTLSL